MAVNFTSKYPLVTDGDAIAGIADIESKSVGSYSGHHIT